MKYRKQYTEEKHSGHKITNSMVKMQIMVVLLVVRCREMGNEAYMETSLLQLLMYIIPPGVYELIYEALGIHVMHGSMYTLSNKNPLAEVTCGTVAIIIQVVLLSPYLRIRGISLSSIHYNQSHRIYINRRQQYICLI